MRWGTWWALLGLGLALIRPAPAAACSRPGPSAWVEPVPANGVAVLRVYCPELTADCDPTVPETITVIDTKVGLPVPGAIVRVRSASTAPYTAIVAWRADEPLIVGRRYRFNWRPVTDDDVPARAYEFAAQPAVSWSASDLELATELRLDIHGDAFIECETAYPNSCGEKTAVLETERRSDAAIEIALQNLENRGLQDQLEVRTAYWADDADPVELGDAEWPVSVQQLRGSFEQPARRYCYRIELHSLVDDSRALREGCIEHGELGDVGAEPLSLANQADLLRACIEPPRGFEDAWCEGQATLCEDQPEGGACARLEACSGERSQHERAKGGSGEGAAGDGGGCSVHPHRSSSRLAGWLAFGLLAIAAQRRRRYRPARRFSIRSATGPSAVVTEPTLTNPIAS